MAFIGRVEEIWPGTLERVVAMGLDGDWLDEATSYQLINTLLLDLNLIPVIDQPRPKNSLTLRAGFQLVEDLLNYGDAEMEDAAAIEVPETFGLRPDYYAKVRPLAGPALTVRLDSVHNWRPDPDRRSRHLRALQDPEP